MTKEPQDLTKDEQDRLYALIPTVFSPGTPITRKQLFAGRREQMVQVLESIYNPGQHVIVYGDRGIGKTSLASVLTDFSAGGDTFVLCRVNCGSSDTFDSVWKKMFTQVAIPVPGAVEGETHPKTLAEILGETRITPFVVQQQLAPISTDPRTHVIMIFDEFDTMVDSETRRLFAETIKTLSDFAVRATVILVGIADSVEKLIAEHQSIERNLAQVRMPRMTSEELEEILITNGLEKLGLGIVDSAKEWIVKLSQGLPNYTHSLGKNSAMVAAGALKRNITVDHVAQAIRKALEQTNHTIKNSYAKATACPRKNILKQVLLACALAPTDRVGSFAAVDVRGPLRKIMKDDSYDIPSFAPHLKSFSGATRPVLIKMGTKKNYRYRFIEPVLQPYVIMEGWNSGMLDNSYFGPPASKP